jgi:hypothetical protein
MGQPSQGARRAYLSRLGSGALAAVQNNRTYFTVLRATSQRQGNEKTPFGRIQNIARARVVVS